MASGWERPPRKLLQYVETFKSQHVYINSGVAGHHFVALSLPENIKLNINWPIKKQAANARK